MWIWTLFYFKYFKWSTNLLSLLFLMILTIMNIQWKPLLKLFTDRDQWFLLCLLGGDRWLTFGRISAISISDLPYQFLAHSTTRCVVLQYKWMAYKPCVRQVHFLPRANQNWLSNPKLNNIGQHPDTLYFLFCCCLVFKKPPSTPLFPLFPLVKVDTA